MVVAEETLAIDGGSPVRATPMPGTTSMSSRAMGDEEIAALTEVIRSGKLGRHEGSKVKELERAFAELYGAKHAVAVSSGSAAVHTAVATVNPEPGDEFITTPCSDFGTVLGVLWQNAIPVFADLDPETLGLDPASVESRITPRTRGIIAVHPFGAPPDLDALRGVADRHGIPLIEDCAQSQLGEWNGHLAGSIGDLACFSLNSTKHLNAGEGGMVLTSSDELAERARLFADKAWPRQEVQRYSLFLGQNYRMNELSAAVALVGLSRIAENVAHRRAVAKAILDGIAGLSIVRAPRIPAGSQSSYWILHLWADPAIDIDWLADAISAEGIPFRPRYVSPLYTWPVFTDAATYGASRFPFRSEFREDDVRYGPGLCPRYEGVREHLLVMSLDELWEMSDAEDVVRALKKVDVSIRRQSLS
ncbi:MAG: DegT/DnrJ/EryC1/StrS family aminotransferase [Thermomicrobiales bacterium]|nr:DegT/DnrJ/EryC1/StrS family aminotransferase [Thermomicrobiales bacterium]